MVDSNVEIQKKRIKRNQRLAIWTLVIGITCILISPYFLTGFFTTDFRTTGQIGDTIGGTTAPIVGLISAVLVYLSFRQQIIANEMQMDLIISSKNSEAASTEKELLIVYLNEIKDSIIHLNYSPFNTKDSFFEGRKAIEMYGKDIEIYQAEAVNFDFYDSITLIVGEIIEFILECENKRALNKEEKRFFIKRAVSLYLHNIFYYVEGIQEHDGYIDSEVRFSSFDIRIQKVIDKYDF